jgi:hypothetical protein
MMGLLTLITMMCRPTKWPGITAESFVFNSKSVLLTQRLSTMVANGFDSHAIPAVYRAALSTFPGHNQYPPLLSGSLSVLASGAGLREDRDLSQCSL